MSFNLLKTPKKLILRENVEACVICCDKTKKNRRCLNSSDDLLRALLEISPDFSRLFGELGKNRDFQCSHLCNVLVPYDKGYQKKTACGNFAERVKSRI